MRSNPSSCSNRSRDSGGADDAASDLEDTRAEIGELARTERRGDRVLERDHGDPIQRSHKPSPSERSRKTEQVFGVARTDLQSTYILDLATLVWRHGPTLPAMVPLGVPQTSAARLYDRFNREVKYVLTHGLQFWQLLDIHYTIWRL